MAAAKSKTKPRPDGSVPGTYTPVIPGYRPMNIPEIDPFEFSNLEARLNLLEREKEQEQYCNEIDNAYWKGRQHSSSRLWFYFAVGALYGAYITIMYLKNKKMIIPMKAV